MITREIIIGYEGKPPLNTMPIFVGELVRCKDCAYWKDDKSKYNQPSWLPCMEAKTRGEWFCAYGRRKDNIDQGDNSNGRT